MFLFCFMWPTNETMSNQFMKSNPHNHWTTFRKHNQWCLSSFQLCKKHVHVQKIYFSRWISTFLFTFLFNDPKDNIVIKSSICNYSQYDCGWLTIAFCNWNRWIILLSSFYERLMEENLSLWNSFSALSHTKTWGIISALDKYAH